MFLLEKFYDVWLLGGARAKILYQWIVFIHYNNNNLTKQSKYNSTGSGSYSNTRRNWKELVPRNSRCCEAIYMGFWGGKIIFIIYLFCPYFSNFWSSSWNDSNNLSVVGCQAHKHWECIDLSRRSFIPNGLHGSFAGKHIICFIY